MQEVTHAKTFQLMRAKYEQGQERVPGREGEPSAAAASEAALQAARRRPDARSMDKGQLPIGLPASGALPSPTLGTFFCMQQVERTHNQSKYH